MLDWRIFSPRREERADAFIELNNMPTDLLVGFHSWDDLGRIRDEAAKHIRKHKGTQHSPVGELHRRLTDLLED